MNRRVLLASRPHGAVGEGNFSIADAPLPVPADGEVLVVHADGTRDPVFLIHAYLGSMLHYRRLAPYLSADQPIVGVHALGSAHCDQSLSCWATQSSCCEQLKASRPAQPPPSIGPV